MWLDDVNLSTFFRLFPPLAIAFSSPTESVGDFFRQEGASTTKKLLSLSVVGAVAVVGMARTTVEVVNIFVALLFHHPSEVESVKALWWKSLDVCGKIEKIQFFL